MNTALLRNLQRTKGHNRKFVTTQHGYDGKEFPVTIELRMHRGARCRIWTAQWFPCWLLTCMWDVWTAEVRGLHSLASEMRMERNSHYLPWNAFVALRAISA